MMEFKGAGHEREFQIFFAEQHITWDLLLYCICWLMTPTAIIKFWRNSRVRSPLWYAVFLAQHIIGKGGPTFLITRYPNFYSRHRTRIILAVRVLEILGSRAYLSFWMDLSNKEAFSEWLILACIFPNNWASPLLWGTLMLIPNRWWLIIQTVDLARLFLYNTTSLRQLDGGLHHLAPLAGAVNAVAAKIGMHSIHARDMLFFYWLALEVFGGFVVPLWLSYRMQLASRRQWRRGVLKRATELQPHGETREMSIPAKDCGLDIRPTWTLFLPESMVFLTLSFVAGHDFKLLQYMI